jgi:hypothetical protein
MNKLQTIILALAAATSLSLCAAKESNAQVYEKDKQEDEITYGIDMIQAKSDYQLVSSCPACIHLLDEERIENLNQYISFRASWWDKWAKKETDLEQPSELEVKVERDEEAQKKQEMHIKSDTQHQFEIMQQQAHNKQRENDAIRLGQQAPYRPGLPTSVFGGVIIDDSYQRIPPVPSWPLYPGPLVPDPATLYDPLNPAMNPLLNPLWKPIF